MTNEHVILIAVREPHRSALRGWCAAQDVALLELPDPSTLASLEGDNVLLCVLALASDGAVSDDGIRSLRKWLGTAPLVVLAYGIGVDCTVRLIRSGVADVIEASGPSSDVVGRVTRYSARDELDDDLVGTSPGIRSVREEIAAVGHLSSTVLIKGEAGVGKGAVARAIHRSSRRRNGPFVHVDCVGVPGASIERDIFGAEETGDLPPEPGGFRDARGGTLFLDEVADLGPDAQARLLGLLARRDDMDLEAIGAQAAPARLIAATCRDLRDEVGVGRFRADLYFRLNVFPLWVPPLRERLTDLGELVRAGLDRIGARLGVTPPPLSPAVYRAMAEYNWPGNVRELMAVLERALVRHHGGLFDERQLIGSLGHPDRMGPEEGTPVSRAAVAGALVATGGNIARAARRLGVPRTTLRYRISALGLDSLLPRD